MKIAIEESWEKALHEEFDKAYFINLISFVEEEYSKFHILPQKEDLFNAFNHCPFENVKVVILGQDPYPTPGQACGLAFSVPSVTPQPPSLRNIFKELEKDLNKTVPVSGCLDKWAYQGVFLLNSILTVRSGHPQSHCNKGWETFTDATIKKLSEQREHLVFMLWGKYAQSKAKLIDKHTHLILTASHPSPRSAHRSFFGCRHFSQANEYLKSHHLAEIDW